MIILHGIYDNGKVVLTDQEKPNIRQEIQIILNPESSDDSEKKSDISMFFNRFHKDLTCFKFDRNDANER
ncbi:MAG: hypothetical protein A2Y33_06130 [Spirochaetes bacterium GWF1_51_8]|nr:MAG: hypothetical protein A2Y33_06130 [Spirochaetes bacterium GWF1_51_8]